MEKHFRKTIGKRNISLQLSKYAGTMYQLGFKARYDSCQKCFAIFTSIGLYNAVFLIYKKI